MKYNFGLMLTVDMFYSYLQGAGLQYCKSSIGCLTISFKINLKITICYKNLKLFNQQ